MVREFFKRRYIVIEVITRNKLEKLSIMDKELQKTIEGGVQKSHGLIGAGQIMNRLKVKYLGTETKTCIIRIPRKTTKMVLESISSIKKIGFREGSFNVLTVSGTLRGCHKWLRKYHFESLPKLIQEATKNRKSASGEVATHLRQAIEKTDEKITELEATNKF